MKKLHLKAVALVFLAGSIAALGTVLSENRARSENTPRSADQPHRIALIDMARVFKQYNKFTSLREELKADLQKSEERFKLYAEEIRKLQTELKTYKEGSPEYSTCEKKAVALTTQAETFRKTAQRDLVRREAQIYKTIYLEVADAVTKYATFKNYTLVLRFSADEVESSENPEEVMRGLNRQVVYYRPSDDITNTIVKYLNRQYDTASNPGEPAAPARR